MVVGHHMRLRIYAFLSKHKAIFISNKKLMLISNKSNGNIPGIVLHIPVLGSMSLSLCCSQKASRHPVCIVVWLSWFLRYNIVTLQSSLSSLLEEDNCVFLFTRELERQCCLVSCRVASPVYYIDKYGLYRTRACKTRV